MNRGPRMNHVVLRNSSPDYGTEAMWSDCPVCLARGFGRIRHKHFSSAYQRQAVTARGENTMECPVCQEEHPANINTTRIKAVFTSSTLAWFHKDDHWPGTGGYHLETEAIGGAKFRFQQRVWTHLYKDVPKGIDTHVVSGLNDILQIINIPSNPELPLDKQIEVKTQVFMERIWAWRQTTVDHARRHGLETPNRFSVATVLRPPQLYYLPGNKNQVWETHNDLIDSINRAIEEFNYNVRTENNEILGRRGMIPVVQGCKNIGMRMSSRGKWEHMMSKWRESEPRVKLHLVPELQAKTMIRVLRFFKGYTPNPTLQYQQDHLRLLYPPPSYAPVTMNHLLAPPPPPPSLPAISPPAPGQSGSSSDEQHSNSGQVGHLQAASPPPPPPPGQSVSSPDEQHSNSGQVGHLQAPRVGSGVPLKRTRKELAARIGQMREKLRKNEE